jgi:hypothetical protein
MKTLQAEEEQGQLDLLDHLMLEEQEEQVQQIQ